MKFSNDPLLQLKNIEQTMFPVYNVSLQSSKKREYTKVQ